MAKRFVKSAINWEEFQKLVPPEDKVKYLAFKAKWDMYTQRVKKYQETPPQIDWKWYEKMITDKGLVDKIKQSYESFKVPYPEDKLSAKVDEQWNELQPQIKAFCEKQQKLINEAQKELDALNALPPFEDITMEMFYDLYNQHALDPVKRPTFWPHTEDEQLGYVEPELIAKKDKK